MGKVHTKEILKFYRKNYCVTLCLLLLLRSILSNFKILKFSTKKKEKCLIYKT